MCSRFRIFRKPITLKPDIAERIVLTTCTLHNWLRKRSSTYLSRGLVDTEDADAYTFTEGWWRNENSRALRNLEAT
jgi:hypothetical protein